MENIGIPIIVIISYMIGEVYKLISKNKDTYKIIPIITTVCGGAIGVIIYYTNPSVLLNPSDVWTALLLGFISGSSSTGTNQIIKQVFKNDERITRNNEE